MSEFRLSAKEHDRLKALRREFHRIPEPGFAEHKTADRICQALDEYNIPYERGIAGTGIVAKLGSGVGPTRVGFRADIDALAISEATHHAYPSQHDGYMHACGHDGHITMLLGAAQVLSLREEIDGQLYCIFQPAEEHGQGAIKMLDEGLLERFPMDAIYGLHNAPLLDVGHMALTSGPIMAAEDNFIITVTGVGGHAAMPHAGKDAMTIAASIVTELQTIVSRNLDPLKGGVVSCTEFLTDGAVNVIPSVVTIKGDARSFDPEVSELIERRIGAIAHGIGDAHGAEIEFSYRRVFPPTINTQAEAQLASLAAADACGVHSVDDRCAPMMASEDFGAMLLQRPGCYAFVGNRSADGAGGEMLHRADYDFNDEAIRFGVNYWVSLASRVFAP